MDRLTSNFDLKLSPSERDRLIHVRFSLSLWIILFCVFILWGCEDSTTSNDNIEGFENEPVKGGQSLINTEIDEGHLNDRIDMANRMTGILDQGINDLGETGGIALHVFDEDASITCISGERRALPNCGFERCLGGEWVTEDVEETCNRHDDDCDGLIDEPMITPSSVCCTEIMCLERSWCEEGRCLELAPDQCILDGDCSIHQLCEAERCVSNFDIEPPWRSASCEEPLELSRTISRVTGEEASSIFSMADSGCGLDGFSLMEGYEFIFSTSRIGPFLRRLSVSADVNGREIPVTVSIYETCALMSLSPRFQCVTNYTGDGGPVDELIIEDLDFILFEIVEPEAVIVVDTLGDALFRELENQRARIEDLRVRIMVD